METKDILKKLRNDKGETLSELSKRVGISQPTLSRYEKGDRKPKYEQLRKLADHFNVSVGYLQGLSDYTNDLDLWAQTLSDEPDAQQRLAEEYDKIKNSSHSTGNVSSDMELAASNFEHLASGTNEQALTRRIGADLSSLKENVTHFYTDPQKKPAGFEGRILNNKNDFGKAWFHDELDVAYYEFLINAIDDFDRYIRLGYDKYIGKHDHAETNAMINELILRLQANAGLDDKNQK
ncbi:helix-turn-helix domain-containing protein [Weissella cibaria]|uniref:helix-turn-helix domain-containing protein n=1 Tax=Weissella cibaria TaxID=137591 RepID=UPI001194A5FE|nr:helix-turn-helix domain-containing protein [Weissella cibaria]TVV32474.1 helix-turn-helix domain-containing protein [Weissella cibaria]